MEKYRDIHCCLSYACLFATSYERFVMDKELVIYAEATDQIEVGRALRAERAVG